MSDKVCLTPCSDKRNFRAAGTGWAANRWDWTGLGVPPVLQSHTHGIERVQKDGITFYTVARGGGSHHGWGTINAMAQIVAKNAWYLMWAGLDCLAYTAEDGGVSEFTGRT